MLDLLHGFACCCNKASGLKIEKGCAGGQFSHFGWQGRESSLPEHVANNIVHQKSAVSRSFRIIRASSSGRWQRGRLGRLWGHGDAKGEVAQKPTRCSLFIACPEVEVSKPGATTSKAGGQKGAALKEHTYRFSVIIL